MLLLTRRSSIERRACSGSRSAISAKTCCPWNLNSSKPTSDTGLNPKRSSSTARTSPDDAVAAIRWKFCSSAALTLSYHKPFITPCCLASGRTQVKYKVCITIPGSMNPLWLAKKRMRRRLKIARTGLQSVGSVLYCTGGLVRRSSLIITPST